MAEEDVAFAHAFGASGADVVGGHVVDHAHAGEACDIGGEGKAEGDAWEDEISNMSPATDGEDAEPKAKDQEQECADDEAGEADADEGDGESTNVGETVGLGGTDNACEDAYDDGDQDGGCADGYRNWKAVGDDFVDVAVAILKAWAEVEESLGGWGDAGVKSFLLASFEAA